MTAPLAIALNGLQVSTASVTIPYVGLWSADVALTTPSPIPSGPGALTLTVGNRTLTGTAYRAAGFAGERTVRCVGGFGGWGKPITARHYKNGAGNRLSMLLQDVAAEVGEQVQLAADVTLSGLHCRIGSTPDNPVPASRVLRQLAGALWWVDDAGVTHIGPRPSTKIASPFTVVHWHGATGSFEIATEDPASWLPGNTFSTPTVLTPQTISSVSISSDNEGVMRFRVLSTGEAVAA